MLATCLHMLNLISRGDPYQGPLGHLYPNKGQYFKLARTALFFELFQNFFHRKVVAVYIAHNGDTTEVQYQTNKSQQFFQRQNLRGVTLIRAPHYILYYLFKLHCSRQVDNNFKRCFLVCEKILIVAKVMGFSVQLGRQFSALNYMKNTKFVSKIGLFS